MPEMHLKLPGFIYSACGSFTKNNNNKKNELKKFCEQKIQTIFTRMILIKLVFNMIWLITNITI